MKQSLSPVVAVVVIVIVVAIVGVAIWKFAEKKEAVKAPDVPDMTNDPMMGKGPAPSAKGDPDNPAPPLRSPGGGG